MFSVCILSALHIICLPIVMLRRFALACCPGRSKWRYAVNAVGVVLECSLGCHLVPAERMRAGGWESNKRCEILLHVNIQREDIMELRKSD